MLLLSMGVSVDGFISDRDGNFNWSVPSDDLFAFHTERVGELGAFVCGRRLYETMLVWETDPRMRENDADAAFADVQPHLVAAQSRVGYCDVTGAADAAAAAGQRQEAAGVGTLGSAVRSTKLRCTQPRCTMTTVALFSSASGVST